MVMFKKVVIIACLLSILPMRAMDGGYQDNGFFDLVYKMIGDHPIATTISMGALGLSGWAFRALYKSNKNEDIFRALCKGDVEKARQLIANGADINALSSRNGGETFLHTAVLSNRKDVIMHLLDLGADKKIRNVAGLDTPIGLACGLGRPQLAIEILCHVRLDRDKKVAPASRKRIITALWIFNKTNLPKLPKDVQLEILAYLPEDVVSADHCRLLFNKGCSVEALLDTCPIEWFKNIYDASNEQAKVALLDAIVPPFTERKLTEIATDISEVAKNQMAEMNNDQMAELINELYKLERENIKDRVKRAFLNL